MMKQPTPNNVLALLLCFACLLPMGVHALANKEDAEAGFLTVVNTYLAHLSAGNYEAAAAMTDFRGLAAHLIQQRLVVLKRDNPDMTPEEERQIVAGLREKEVHPVNLRKILIEMLRELDPKGMKLEMTKVFRLTANENGRIVEYSISDESGPLRTAQVGVMKIGPDWVIAPQVVEQAAIPQVEYKDITPPESLVAAGNTFWTHWKNGALDQAYAMCAAGMKTRVPFLTFLESGQKSIEQLGILLSWKLLSCVEAKPGSYRTTYGLRCTKQPVKALIILVPEGEGWQIGALILPYVGK